MQSQLQNENHFKQCLGMNSVTLFRVLVESVSMRLSLNAVIHELGLILPWYSLYEIYMSVYMI